MDIRMPGLDGIQATRLLAGEAVSDPLRVVVVTTYDMDENVYAALRAGACGFLLKDAGPRLLIEAVRAAADGESRLTSMSNASGWNGSRSTAFFAQAMASSYLARHSQK